MSSPIPAVGKHHPSNHHPWPGWLIRVSMDGCDSVSFFISKTWHHKTSFFKMDVIHTLPWIELVLSWNFLNGFWISLVTYVKDILYNVFLSIRVLARISFNDICKSYIRRFLFIKVRSDDPIKKKGMLVQNHKRKRKIQKKK